MKALKYFSPWNIALCERPELDCLAPDDVIVSISVCGLCGTDLGIISGQYAVARPGVTLGHEASGTVLKIGDAVTTLGIGDRVVIDPTYSCRTCRMCLIGNGNHCEMKNGTEAGVSYDGAFAGQYRGKAAFLIKLDPHVSMAAASFTEPLSCALTGLDKLAIGHTDIRAVVIGAGPMGALYAWALHQSGVRSFVVENNPARRAFAHASLPPSVAVYHDLREGVTQEYGWHDNQLDLAVDTSGHLAGRLINHLAPGGKLLNVALKANSVTLDTLLVADKSLSVIGSIDSLNNSFERAYAFIRDGEIPVSNLVSHLVKLQDYEQALLTVGCDIARRVIAPSSTPNCKVLLSLEHDQA